jgi:hypothetical protein
MSVGSTIRVHPRVPAEVPVGHDELVVAEAAHGAAGFNPWAALWQDDGPWSRSDARTALSTGGVGLVILGWAWWEASGSADLDSQTGWLVVGVLGVIVVLKGLISWLRGGWRAVRERRAAIALAFERAGIVDLDPSSSVDDGLNDGSLVVVTGSNRFHRRDCLLVRGKPVRVTAGGRKLKACEMCMPSMDVRDGVMR